MILLTQIRAARGLLGWSQAELAKTSGLSLTAITKIESGKVDPRMDSLAAIQLAFEKNGVEFLDAPGVQMRSDPFNVEVWKGASAVLTLWSDITKNLSISKKNVLMLSGVDEGWWLKHYREPLKKFQHQLSVLNVKSRLLICEGDKLLTGSPENYRQVPEWLFAQTPHYIYDDKVALITVGPPVRIVCIQSAPTAETFRRQFDLNWRQGKKIEE